MPPRKPKPRTGSPEKPDLVALVERQVHGNVMEEDEAEEQLRELLATDADFTAAAARAVELLTEQSGPKLQTLLAVVNRCPPADWAARLDGWFKQAARAKTARDRRRAAYLLVRIAGGDRWADFTPNLHPPDLWPRLWALSQSSKDRDVRKEITDGVTWGLRACPDRTAAERFAIEQKLADAAVDWAWIGEDTRDLMDRMFAAKVAHRELASPFTIVYELQHGRAAAAHELFRRLDENEQGYQAQEIALYGKRIRPVAAVIEWLGMLLASPLPRVRYKAAWSACERAEKFGQDIGPILPALGRLMDNSKPSGEGGYALWWGVSVIAVTTVHFPQHRDAAIRELTSRLTGKKAVQREAAGYGLAEARMLARDPDGVRELWAHADAKVCAGAIRGMYGAAQHMDLPGNMHDFRRIVKPLMPRLRKLMTDPRADVAEAATRVNGWL